MPQPAKRRSKASGKFSPSDANALPTIPPTPFLSAPESLKPFLHLLPKEHIYVTSIDTHTRDFKRQIFLVPLLTNIAILAFIAWRALRMAPFYASLFLASTGYARNTITLPADAPWSIAFREILGRFLNMLLDFILLVYILQWPKAFFIGGDFGTPIEWRWSIGFRNEEVVVRRSKKNASFARDVEKLVTENDSLEFRQFAEVVAEATDREYMMTKTGYAMLNKYWDLDFLAMTDATFLVDKKELSLQDFGIKVYLYSEMYGWLIYDTKHNVTAGDEEAEQRRKIVAFKDELTGLGKENLFFKWIELIQFESSQAGGLEKRQSILTKARDMFQDQGVDFKAFCERIGLDGFPGLEQFI